MPDDVYKEYEDVDEAVVTIEDELEDGELEDDEKEDNFEDLGDYSLAEDEDEL